MKIVGELKNPKDVIKKYGKYNAKKYFPLLRFMRNSLIENAKNNIVQKDNELGFILKMLANGNKKKIRFTHLFISFTNSKKNKHNKKHGIVINVSDTPAIIMAATKK